MFAQRTKKYHLFASPHHLQGKKVRINVKHRNGIIFPSFCRNNISHRIPCHTNNLRQYIYDSVERDDTINLADTKYLQHSHEFQKLMIS